MPVRHHSPRSSPHRHSASGQAHAVPSPSNEATCPTSVECISHVRVWLAAYENWDLERMYNLATSLGDFEYSYFPASAGIPPKSLKAEVLKIYECNGCVVTHVVGRATSRFGTPFLQEYVLFHHCRYELDALSSERSIKIHKVEEFVDTHFSRTFFAGEKAEEKEIKNQLQITNGGSKEPRSTSTSMSAGRRYNTSKL
ncbi:uncharacterized protein EI90DRAFT_3125268 [Cantharellus anzutake]|uniref:uncharacterized protein n=1 Tax=Cantharellus anzutake TaxID=1750568 RepID=UPI001908DA9B|nr:uncharacterized protein EI90DRAFT_3125268 [Cantharellus anzutake]KAF8329508.1 hypothetical protein EI90DRAFT_3125268 [Cantharellus anzutake]